MCGLARPEAFVPFTVVCATMYHVWHIDMVNIDVSDVMGPLSMDNRRLTAPGEAQRWFLPIVGFSF